MLATVGKECFYCQASLGTLTQWNLRLGEGNGGLAIDCRSALGTWTGKEIRLESWPSLHFMAPQALPYAESRDENEARFRLLAYTAGRLLASNEPLHLIQDLCTEVMEYLDCDFFLNYKYIAAQQLLRVHASAGLTSEELARSLEVPMDAEAPCTFVARHQIPYFAQHIAASNEPGLSSPQRFGIRAYCCYPLIAQGQLMGTLGFGSKRADRFTDHQIETIRVVADQVAVALQRVKAQRELREALKIADAANQSKSQFLANISHEIRTPLGAILGFTELLRDKKEFDVDAESWLSAIERNGRLLASLIDDVLDLSKVEAGKLQIEVIEVDLAGLLRDVMAGVSLKASEKGLELSIIGDPNLPEKVRTDPLRLKQILLNILGNAVKFTQTGDVTARISLESSTHPNKGLLRIVVTDTGEGMTEEESLKLFEPFHQSDASTTRKFGGTGLGLALSRRLARAMEGDVVLLRSRRGQGSSFAVTIPVERVQEEAIKPAAPNHTSLRSQTLTGLQVLLAEDMPDNQLIIKRFLTSAGASVDLAAHGREAITKALQKDYDVVLMDIQMPHMDGYEAIARLKDHGYQRPLVALTAHAFQEERQRLLALGCKAHITKPIQRDHLIQLLADLAAQYPIGSKEADLRFGSLEVDQRN